MERTLWNRTTIIPMQQLHRSKSLSEVERLRLLVAKQEVEIARLKKDIGWKELVQTGSTLLATERLRSSRRTQSKVPVDFLCKIMGINRSGYYKWKSSQGKLNRYEQDRIILTQLLREEHKLHPSLGYHRLARNIFNNTGWVFSDNLAHKCCKAAGIRSKSRKCRYRPPGEESIKYENLVKGHWNAKAPASDRGI